MSKSKNKSESKSKPKYCVTPRQLCNSPAKYSSFEVVKAVSLVLPSLKSSLSSKEKRKQNRKQESRIKSSQGPAANTCLLLFFFQFTSPTLQLLSLLLQNQQRYLFILLYSMYRRPLPCSLLSLEQSILFLFS